MVRVDVQGFEGLVVEGMQQLLRRKQVSFALPLGSTHVASLSISMYSSAEALRQPRHMPHAGACLLYDPAPSLMPAALYMSRCSLQSLMNQGNTRGRHASSIIQGRQLIA